jgi:hypothetical protein
MTCVVVSQPMFLPWRGIFEQMQMADIFVFYDDVQLPLGRSFITRVQIKSPGGPAWLSLPVSRAGRGNQLICEAHFSNLVWKQKHCGSLRACYARTPGYPSVWTELIEPIYDLDTVKLSEFCILGMQRIAGYLGIKPTFMVSSDMRLEETADASERILAICKRLGATKYVTGHGAAQYLRHEIFEDAGVAVRYADYALLPYPQRFGPFTPYVTILDLLFNVGNDALRYLEPRTVYWRDWLSRQ